MCIAAERGREPVRSALNSVVLEIPCFVFVDDVLRASPLVNDDVTWMDHILYARTYCKQESVVVGESGNCAPCTRAVNYKLLRRTLSPLGELIDNVWLRLVTAYDVLCYVTELLLAGFRPSFHLYNKWSSLVGALVCVVIMFMLSWWAALVTVLVVGALYSYLKYRKPG